MGQLRMFEGYGVELEYMIVGEADLSVRPVCDQILFEIAGSYEPEVEMGRLNWSNEVVLHVIELKTNGPVASLDGLAEVFQQDVSKINSMLTTHQAKLLPTAMHPWMDPHRETVLWPHENSPIYSGYDRIFNCQGHGWSNLQSIHLNLPFQGDAEFGRLHAAIRLVLPLLPAIAASSPFADGTFTGMLDSRLNFYRYNQKKIPSIGGDIIPEPVFTEQDYRHHILQKMYDDIAPLDPEKILQDEWLNSRGAIARFIRDTIEIRLLDIQECPAADLAILEVLAATIRALVEERWSDYDRQTCWPVAPLKSILLDAIQQGEQAVIENPDYLNLFQLKVPRCTAGQLWDHLAEKTGMINPSLTTLLQQGTLARRILRSVGEQPSRDELRSCYNRLSECLACGILFCPSEALVGGE